MHNFYKFFSIRYEGRISTFPPNYHVATDDADGSVVQHPSHLVRLESLGGEGTETRDQSSAVRGHEKPRGQTSEGKEAWSEGHGAWGRRHILKVANQRSVVSESIDDERMGPGSTK